MKYWLMLLKNPFDLTVIDKTHWETSSAVSP